MITTTVHYTCDLCGKSESLNSESLPHSVAYARGIPKGWDSMARPHKGFGWVKTLCCAECLAPFREAQRLFREQSKEFYKDFFERREVELLAKRAEFKEIAVEPVHPLFGLSKIDKTQAEEAPNGN